MTESQGARIANIVNNLAIADLVALRVALDEPAGLNALLSDVGALRAEPWKMVIVYSHAWRLCVLDRIKQCSDVPLKNRLEQGARSYLYLLVIGKIKIAMRNDKMANVTPVNFRRKDY